jgi:hypothetical protein
MVIVILFFVYQGKLFSLNLTKQIETKQRRTAPDSFVAYLLLPAA